MSLAVDTSEQLESDIKHDGNSVRPITAGQSYTLLEKQECWLCRSHCSWLGSQSLNVVTSWSRPHLSYSRTLDVFWNTYRHFVPSSKKNCFTILLNGAVRCWLKPLKKKEKNEHPATLKMNTVRGGKHREYQLNNAEEDEDTSSQGGCWSCSRSGMCVAVRGNGRWQNSLSGRRPFTTAGSCRLLKGWVICLWEPLEYTSGFTCCRSLIEVFDLYVQRYCKMSFYWVLSSTQ